MNFTEFPRVLMPINTRRRALASIAFLPPHDGQTLTVTFGSDATEGLANGTYTAWDCLLEAYRAEIGGVADLFPTYAPTLFFDGIFDLPRLAELFAQLVDASVDINVNVNVGRRGICVVRDGEHYEYVADQTAGEYDSARGCTGRAGILSAMRRERSTCWKPGFLKEPQLRPDFGTLSMSDTTSGLASALVIDPSWIHQVPPAPASPGRLEH